MTLRDLLKSLHAVDEKFLDADVLVSPASGGYEGVSHVSVLYAGNAVIHLAEPTPAEPPDLWAGSGEGDLVAAVSSNDLKNVWNLFRDIQARNPGEHTAIDNSVYQSVCTPGANTTAVWYRASMLEMLKMFPESPLSQWTHGGQLDDVVFDVAATFPMKKMQAGIVHDEPPFDVEEFVRRIGARI